LQQPGCVVPWIPEKDAEIKISGVDSQKVKQRQKDLEKFLHLVILNAHLCDLKVLDKFL